MAAKRLNILFVSAWYPHKMKPLNGIFVKRHAAANTIDCNVSAIFVCSADEDMIEESEEDGIYTLRGYYKAPRKKLFPFYHILKLRAYLAMWDKVITRYQHKKGKPDLIHSTIAYPVSVIARRLSSRWNIPYIITEHWTGYFPEDGRYKGTWMKWATNYAVRKAGAVVTDSAKLGRTMTALGLKNRYYTIPNVVDPQVFYPANNTIHAPFTFIHVSSLDNDQKNVTGILRTFANFHARYPLSKLVIVGDSGTAGFNQLIKDIRTEGVQFAGTKTGKELAALFNQSAAFVLFSNYENLPCVMLEAFMSGIPVIGTNVGDVPDFINSKNGILVHSGNEKELYNAMEKIYHNYAQYNPAEIMELVADRVSPAAISKQFSDIYNQVLNHAK